MNAVPRKNGGFRPFIWRDLTPGPGGINASFQRQSGLPCSRNLKNALVDTFPPPRKTTRVERNSPAIPGPGEPGRRAPFLNRNAGDSASRSLAPGSLFEGKSRFKASAAIPPSGDDGQTIKHPAGRTYPVKYPGYPRDFNIRLAGVIPTKYSLITRFSIITIVGVPITPNF